MDAARYQGWISVFESGTDYEAEIVRDRLLSLDVPAVVLTQRDHAFNLTHGYLARVRVMVPPDRAREAADILESPPLSNDDLTRIALAADPGPRTEGDGDDEKDR